MSGKITGTSKKEDSLISSYLESQISLKNDSTSASQDANQHWGRECHGKGFR